MAMTMNTTNVAGGKTFLAASDFKARPYTLKSADVSATNGKKIVKAGTPLPANDGTALGLLLEDVDVTLGDKAVALVFEGEVSTAKITATAGITVASTAKAALPRITFFD